MTCGVLVPQPGIEPEPSAVRAWSPNHRTAREFLHFYNFLNYESDPCPLFKKKNPETSMTKVHKSKKLKPDLHPSLWYPRGKSPESRFKRFKTMYTCGGFILIHGKTSTIL